MSVLRICAVVSLLTVVGVTSARGDVVTQWNFNGTIGWEQLRRTLETGTASLVGGTTAAFASGDASGGSSDPAVGSPPDFGWGLTTFPAASGK